jgi:hypothetical protein
MDSGPFVAEMDKLQQLMSQYRRTCTEAATGANKIAVICMPDCCTNISSLLLLLQLSHFFCAVIIMLVGVVYPTAIIIIIRHKMNRQIIAVLPFTSHGVIGRSSKGWTEDWGREKAKEAPAWWRISLTVLGATNAEQRRRIYRFVPNTQWQ